MYETLEAGSPTDMVPAIRNILGGFLFSGDDIYKKAGVLSGGERTRLAVARMLLRPSNTLLLDEPTNHLDLDSKDVLLDALEDYGGTLIIVSHDRYFVEKLATKIIEIGHGQALRLPGHLHGIPVAQGTPRRDSASRIRDPGPEWFKDRQSPTARNPKPIAQDPKARVPNPESRIPSHARPASNRRPSGAKRSREAEALQKRIADLEGRIAEREAQVKELEARMASAGFYDDRKARRRSSIAIRRLMWEVGDLIAQWEALQEHARPGFLTSCGDSCPNRKSLPSDPTKARYDLQIRN